MKKHTFNFRDREQDFNRALKICRHELDTFLQSLTRPAVCQAAFFISAENQKNYSRMKNELSTEFADIVPVFSCAGQAPAEGRLAADMLICERFDPSTEIKVKRLNSHPYIRLQNKGITEIMVSGLCGDLNKSIENQSLSSYEKAKNILAAENMDFSHVYRQWNYIEQITQVDLQDGRERQHYQIYNDIRSQYYGECDFVSGYPAATGIGMDSGGIIIDIMASKGNKVSHKPVMNPDQTDAHCYTQTVLVGDATENSMKKTTPKFERAKLVTSPLDQVLYISGTAAIKGEKTVPSDDIEEQTRITLDNISKLHSNGSNNFPYRRIRAYVKYPHHMKQVETICRDYFGDSHLLMLKADVCRNNLIVEIEAEINLSN